MKIAILIERADPGLGGAERSVRDLAGELNRRGLEATILAATGGCPAEHLTILFPDQKDKRTSLAEFEAALKGHLQTNSYDLIHSTLPISMADVYQPRGGSYRQTLLQNIQSYPNPVSRAYKRAFHSLNTRRTQYLEAEEALLQTNPHVIVAALSEYVKSHFVKHYSLPEERIAVIPNGVSLPAAIDDASVRAFRIQILEAARLPQDQQAILYLFAANNFRLKGLRELILALSRAVKQSSIPLILAAAGSGKPAPYRNLAWMQNVDTHVVFCGPLTEVHTALTACDAAVLPTWYDPSSRFILEALALAKPVITTKLNGAAEMFESGRHGIVIDRPRNIGALADALLRYADPEAIQQASNAIREDTLREKVSIGRHAEQLISLYKRILRRKNGTT